MDTLIRIFRSRKLALSDPPDRSPALPHMDSPMKPAMVYSSPSLLQLLPAEIIYEIFSFLRPLDLVNLSSTSRLLRAHALNDTHWAKFVRENVPHQPGLHYDPAQSWRHLYTSLHPYWFLTKNKIWFSDKAHTGSFMVGTLVLARYDARRGCIEAYRLVAKHGTHTFESWDWKPEVIIHTFNPKVDLYLDDPLVKIDMGLHEHKRAVEEIMMDTGASRGIKAMISLCHGIPPERQDSSMSLWPPKIIPAKERARNVSQNLFCGDEHKPKRLAEVSDYCFRRRQWVEFGGHGAPLGAHVGEDVTTFGTLLEESYTPTKERPWQGIWVGDYSGHGCEFLLVIQRDVDWTIGPPKSSFSWPGWETFYDAKRKAGAPRRVGPGEDGSCIGRVEAIKLTGDINVPRGEYTWIAEDIGPDGLLRIANEQMFQGARVVRSLGHSAARGFKSGKRSVGLRYTQSD
ncbi:MAG: hypothetical protein Q9214_003317 [Letrouitia sp. 1 TL-2023]